MAEEISKADVLAVKPDCRAGAAAEAQGENVAIGKANNTPARLFVLALMAGLQIGFGALFMTYVKADQTLSFAASSLLGGLAFSLGLLCVIVAGSELFTGNCLMVMGACSKRITWGKTIKNWVIVWIGNFLGSLVLVAVVVGAGFMGMKAGDNTVGNQMVTVAAGKINLGPMQIFCRGIVCNVLVCLAVWMGFCGRTVIDKVFTSMMPVIAFVALGGEHCVANMFFLPMGVVASNSGYGSQVLTMGGALYNIGLATVGNIVGGCIFVGLVYWFSYRKKETK